MKIKTSDYSKKEAAHSMALHRLQDVSKINNLPQDLKTEVENLISFFKAYDMSQHKESGIKLEGKVLTEEEVLQAVIEATGYTKWSSFKEEDFNPNWIREKFNLDLKKEDIIEYKVERSTNSRNDVFMISVTCLPGCVNLGFDTGRADHYLDYLVQNEKLKKEIEQNFD